MTISRPPPTIERLRSITNCCGRSVSYRAVTCTALFLNWVLCGQSHQYVLVYNFTNMKIFWKSWNLPLYNRECLLYWLCWHLVVETGLLTVKNPKSTSQYSLLYMWRDFAIWNCSWLSKPTDHENLPTSGSRIQHTGITGDSSQPRMNGPLSITSWRIWGHSYTGPCRCRQGLGSHCIMSSPSSMTCSIIWIAFGTL